jgi:bifunctional DNase/RNase
MLKQMKVEGLLFDPRSGMYILLLKETDGTETLPIWIGKPEADSIALTLGRVTTPRPLTHDLVKNLIEGMRGRVTRMVVSDLVDNTYYAYLEIGFLGGEIRIDARPSDAVAVALRTEAPIFVEPKVMAHRGGDELEGWLKNLKPEDFGNVM